MTTTPGTQPLLPAASMHIVRRFTYGYNGRLAADVLRHRDVDAWFEAQLNPGADPDADATLAWFPRLKDSPGTTFSNSRSDVYSTWSYGSDLTRYSIARRIVGTNQLYEMMVDFWSNLLYIPAREDSSFAWRMDYDAKAIRPHALTSFKQLLHAAVTHPSMSGFLSNHRNTKTLINENLGRELLELYTVGRTAGYSEDDVRNSARLLTGFTVDFAAGVAPYKPELHHVGPVTVMGKTFPNGAADGRAELKNYLHWLAMRPETAERIANRLCTRFVSDEPPRSVIDAVKQTYLDSDSDIKECLRTLVRHPAFKASAMQKARTPVEDVIATQRACDITPTGSGEDTQLSAVQWYCQWTGQSPFTWPRPDGFPEKSDTYLSPARLLRSWNVHTWMANTSGSVSKATRPAPRNLLPPVWPLPAVDLIHHQAVMMTGSRAPADTVKAALSLIEATETTKFKESWQRPISYMSWQLTLIRTAILNSPEAMLR